MTAAVFLDRDNTLIHNDGDLGDPDAVRLVKGAASAIASLRGLSYKIVVVTNQGGVARGKFTEDAVQAVHDRITQLVKETSGSIIDRFYYCPYHPEGKSKKYRREHPWRKPQPGMILQAAEDLGLDLNRSWLIGDQMRDIEAASAAGVRAILLDRAATESPDPDETENPIYLAAPTIIEAVKIIAQQGRIELTHAESSASGPTRRRSRLPDTAVKRQEKGTTSSTSDGQRLDPPTKSAPPRPFRPWMTQPADEMATGTDQATDAPTEPTVEPINGPPAQPEPVSTTSQRLETSNPVGPPAPRTEQILQQILQELRNQRGLESEFSYHQMIAIVLQMIATVCFLGALWMGASNLDIFVRWLGVALGFELATIAMILFRK